MVRCLGRGGGVVGAGGRGQLPLHMSDMFLQDRRPHGWARAARSCGGAVCLRRSCLARLPVPLQHLLPISRRREYKARELTGCWESFESWPGSWGLLSGCAHSAYRRACSYKSSTAARRQQWRQVSAEGPQTRR